MIVLHQKVGKFTGACPITAMRHIWSKPQIISLLHGNPFLIKIKASFSFQYINPMLLDMALHLFKADTRLKAQNIGRQIKNRFLREQFPSLLGMFPVYMLLPDLTSVSPNQLRHLAIPILSISPYHIIKYKRFAPFPTEVHLYSRRNIEEPGAFPSPASPGTSTWADWTAAG